MTAVLRRLVLIVAFIGAGAWLLAGAIDQELASGGVLEERREGKTAGQVDARLVAATLRSSSACAASSLTPERTLTVTSCGEGLSERPGDGALLSSESGFSREAPHPFAGRSENLYQGKPIRWWARRAVQARKDANARGQTIRRLQTNARRQLAYPTGHWLDGAFLCIHRYERGAAGWQTDTGNGYRGGLQMDWSFSSTYGPLWARRAFGANPARWPASVQITAAIQAWTSRGFGPWPNTRLRCGL